MSPVDQPVKLGESSKQRPVKYGSIPLYLINGIATVWDAQSLSFFLFPFKPIPEPIPQSIRGFLRASLPDLIAFYTV